MSEEALLREAERCRRLAGEARDPEVAAALEAVAKVCETRAFDAAPVLEPLLGGPFDGRS